MTTCACGATLGRYNKSGRCRRCFAAALNSDPAMVAKRRAAQIEFFARPETKAVLAARARHLAATMTDAERERRRVRGKQAYVDVLSRPDVVAKTSSPEARARAGRSRTDTVLAWCPPERRACYRELVRKNGLPASEAREIIEQEIPGTPAHARRALANARDAMVIRHHRQKAQAY